MPTTCALCRRVVPDGLDDPQAIQEHHLIPESRAESPTVTLCRPCHRQIHATFTNEELRESYHTIDAFQGAERLSGYLSWIRSTTKLDVHSSVWKSLLTDGRTCPSGVCHRFQTLLQVRTSRHVRERRERRRLAVDRRRPARL